MKFTVLLLFLAFVLVESRVQDNDTDNDDQWTNLARWAMTPQQRIFVSLFDVYGEDGLKKILEDLYKGRATDLACSACKLVVEFAKRFLRTSRVIRSVFYFTCKTFRIEQPRVCKGLAKLFSPELAYILMKSSLSANEKCGVILSPKCMEHGSYTNSRIYWNISIPERSWNKHTSQIHHRQDTRLQSSLVARQNIPKKVVQITDIHLDPYYLVGSVGGCDEPLCCRETSKGKSGSPAGYWGSFGNCDTPVRTFTNLLERINDTQSDYDYLMYTGDVCPHDIWNSTKDALVYESRLLTKQMKLHLPKGKLILPIVGNHEAIPVNMFAPPEVNDSFSVQWLYDELFDQWSDWLPSSAEETFKLAGYYSYTFSKEFKVIALNTNLCARLNFWQLFGPLDPGNQLQWLVKELHESEKAGQAVHIVGHIAPDETECVAVWLENFLRIVARYNDTIKAQFYGHTHYDEVRVYYASNVSEPTSVAFLGPSVTAYENVNPAYRIYSIGEKGIVYDHETYYFILSEANRNGSFVAPNWVKEYSAAESYNMTTQSKYEWHKFVDKMRQDPQYMGLYYDHYYRYTKDFNRDCDQLCRSDFLNSISVGDFHL